MKAFSTTRVIAAAALLALTPAGALAQTDEDVAERANEIAEQAGELANDVANTTAENENAREGDDGRLGTADDRDADAPDDDDGFDWGLLGLLGLAGLLGLKRDRGVHTDTRRDPRV